MGYATAAGSIAVFPYHVFVRTSGEESRVPLYTGLTADPPSELRDAVQDRRLMAQSCLGTLASGCAPLSGNGG